MQPPVARHQQGQDKAEEASSPDGEQLPPELLGWPPKPVAKQPLSKPSLPSSSSSRSARSAATAPRQGQDGAGEASSPEVEQLPPKLQGWPPKPVGPVVYTVQQLDGPCPGLPGCVPQAIAGHCQCNGAARCCNGTARCLVTEACCCSTLPSQSPRRPTHDADVRVWGPPSMTCVPHQHASQAISGSRLIVLMCLAGSKAAAAVQDEFWRASAGSAGTCASRAGWAGQCCGRGA